MRLASIAWRGLLARPLRTALAIVGIALGVAVVTATIITGASSGQALRGATVDLLGRADVRLRAFEDAGFSPRTLQAVRSLPDVHAVAPVAERRLTVSTAPGDNERVFTLLVLGIDADADAAVREPNVLAGEPLTATDTDGVLAPRSWADQYGLGVGDELLLAGRRQGIGPMIISGVIADSGFGALDAGNVLVMSRATLDDVFEIPAPIRYLDVDLGDDPTDAAIGRVTASLGEPFVVETAADAAARFASAQEAFVGVALLFSLVALVIGQLAAQGRDAAVALRRRHRCVRAGHDFLF